MDCNTKLVIILLLASNVLKPLCLASQANEIASENSQDKCSTDDLNLSILVDSSAQTKLHYSKWPTSPENILHIYSSRIGDRFESVTAPNLNYKETEEQRLLDINTTLYVNSKILPFGPLKGFGSNLNSKKLIEIAKIGSAGEAVRPTVADLLRINFSLFRIQIKQADLVNHDAELIISELDASATEQGKMVDLLLSFEELDNNLETMTAVENLLGTVEASHSVRCHSIAHNSEVTGLFQKLRQKVACRRRMDVSLEEAALLLNPGEVRTIENQAFDVLLIKSNHNLSYSAVEFARRKWKSGELIVLAREKPVIRKFGDWQNAQDSTLR